MKTTVIHVIHQLAQKAATILHAANMAHWLMDKNREHLLLNSSVSTRNFNASNYLMAVNNKPYKFAIRLRKPFSFSSIYVIRRINVAATQQTRVVRLFCHGIPP